MEQERNESLSKRQKLIDITEEDKKLKQTWTNINKAKEPKESDKNLITKFFNRTPHQAFELRAKQDLVIDKIGAQFNQTDYKRSSLVFERQKDDDFDVQQRFRI